MVAPFNPTVPPAAFAPDLGKVGDSACATGTCESGECAGRMPMFALFGAGVLWLLVASVLALIASVKLHAPGFLGDCSWLTFGRVKPAASSAFIFGFAAQVGLGLAIWMICRLGKVSFNGWLPALLGLILWNLGVGYGVSKVIVSGGTGHEWLEFPHGAAGLMLLGYLLVALPALVTFRARRESVLAPAQWFILAALFAFPWLWVTGNALLVCEPVRGVVQITTGAWFRAGLLNLWLTPLALAALYHFLPAALGRVARERDLVAFAFWSLIALGAWTGLAHSAPVPAWLTSLSNACAVGFLLAVLAVGYSLFTVLASPRDGADETEASPAIPFLMFSALLFLIGNALHVFGALPVVAKVVALTHYGSGVTALLFGFVTMALLGGLVAVLPELLEQPWPKPQLLRPQFWTLAMGITLSALALVVAGIQQGQALRHAATPFLDTVMGGQMFLVLASLGGALILLGAALVALNFVLLLAAACRACCTSCCSEFRAAPVNPESARAGA